MKLLRKPLARIAALLLGVTALWACNAPFIPVPPPPASFTSQLVDDGAGGQKTVWITRGLVPSEQAALATFHILNQNLGDGVITTAGVDGTYEAPPMDGTEGDRVSIYYRTPEGDYSESICVLLVPTAPSVSAPACP
jgi:hypothetical protein